MNLNFLCCIGAELKNSTQQTTRMTQVYLYRAFESETIADMLSTGFFNQALGIIRQDDLLLLYSPNETNPRWVYARVSSATRDGIEISKVDVQQAQDIPVDTTGYSNLSGNNLQEILNNLDTTLTTINNAFVRKDGSSIMTGPLKFRAGSFEGAIAGGLGDGISIYKLKADGTIDSEVASITKTNGLEPGANNTMNIGGSALKWKDAYIARVITAVLNNGYDIAVPATVQPETLALKSEVDLAANSGRMITDQGVWYAKMYAATVAPSAEDGTNYADFSQTDGQGNPIIVTYNRVNGAWVQDQTITPPAEYDGYVPITSKIWDIIDQTGQQGGRVMWNHQSKEFTPYPQIISFENAALTGVPTAPLPTDASPNNQIATKGYVDDAVAEAASQAGYHPSMLAHEWDDKIRNDMQWLRADTFSWQDGGVYEQAYNHLADDVNAGINRVEWHTTGTVNICYTRNINPQVGDSVYSDTSLTTQIGVVEATGNGITVSNNKVYHYYAAHMSGTLPSETIAGVQIRYFLASDGHKICLAAQESNVAAIYAATGVAWYYILDPENQRFKLPRSKHNKYTETLGVVGNGLVLGLTNGTNTAGTTFNSNTTSINPNRDSYGLAVSSSGTQTGNGLSGRIGVTPDSTKSGLVTTSMAQETDQYKYLYFYVGSFTQTAIENTAGLNAELFNGKADIDLSNTPMATADYVVEWQAPTAQNNYTWYRKYKSGWVEQGGVATTTNTSTPTQCNLPVAMEDGGYCITYGPTTQSMTAVFLADKQTTYFSVITGLQDVGYFAASFNWMVCGMAA